MPLVANISHTNAYNAYIWRRDEENDFFFQHNDIRSAKWQQVAQWHPKRISEWLAGRYLIYKYANCTSRALSIDAHGKPHIQDSARHISISHSGEYVAIAISSYPVGVDIQVKKNRIGQIAPKFTMPQEIDRVREIVALDIDALHLIWNAKEAIYKAYGRKQLDFKRNIHIYNEDKGLKGSMTNPEQSISYNIVHHRFGDLYIGIAVQAD